MSPCGDVIHSYAVLLFLFLKSLMTVTSLFLSEQGCCKDFSMLEQPRMVGTSILGLGLQQSLSARVLLSVRTAIQHGHHLPCLSQLMGSVIHSLYLGRHFASKLCNSSFSLVCADHPDAQCGFMSVARWENTAGDWEVPVSEAGWSCGHVTSPERGKAGSKCWEEAAISVMACFPSENTSSSWMTTDLWCQAVLLVSVVWEVDFLAYWCLVMYYHCSHRVCGSEGKQRLHRKQSAWGRSSESWHLLHLHGDVASWFRAVVLWDPEPLMVDTNAWR